MTTMLFRLVLSVYIDLTYSVITREGLINSESCRSFRCRNEVYTQVLQDETEHRRLMRHNVSGKIMISICYCSHKEA